MDIEQLKLVLATVQGVSGDAFKVGALYIGMQLLRELIAYGLWGAALFSIYKVAVLLAMNSKEADRAVQGIKRTRKALGIGDPLGEPDYRIDETTINATVACVEGMVKQFNDSKKGA